MAKSKAEIQKAYRERQKAKGSAFLEKERLRQKRSNTPAAALSDTKRKDRNITNNMRTKLSILRRKQRYDAEIAADRRTDSDIQSNYQSEQGPVCLIVRLPATNTKGIGLKKTRTRTEARSNALRMPKTENMELKKKVKARNRKITRLIVRFQTLRAKHALNPAKETDSLIDILNLTPWRRNLIRRNFMTCNDVTTEREASKSYLSRKKRRNLSCILSGAITKKYRRLRSIHKSSGIFRWSIDKLMDNRLINVTKIESRKRVPKNVETLNNDFYNRDDDQSWAQSGKADTKTSETGRKEQPRVLTDYLKSLRENIQPEDRDITISLTTFMRYRPNYDLLTSFISRNSCQCIHHQNRALKAQSVRTYGIKVGQNTELVIRMDESVPETLPENVTYKLWKRVNERGKSRMKVIDEKKDEPTFLCKTLRPSGRNPL